MDTSTHFIMGVGLFGLAHVDPTVATHSDTATAVLIATVVGSQIPDSDGLYRLKGASTYTRNHRGWTHSFPMIVIWPLIITVVLALLFPHAYKDPVFLWSSIAVFIHIFIDLFNSYGTQVLRPISKKWVSWDILNIFDLFIFGSHLIGFLLWWLSPIPPSHLFVTVYGLIVLYTLLRTWKHFQLVKWMERQFPSTNRLTVTPTIRWGVWHVIIENDTEVQLGEIRGSRLFWTGYLSTEPLLHPVVQTSKKAEAVDAFLSFTSYGYPELYEKPFGYEVHWRDVRYHYKKQFPFVAVAILDKEEQILFSFVGFMSKQHLEKKVKQLLNTHHYT